MQADDVDRLELKALGGVHGHEPDGVGLRAEVGLAKVPVVGEQHDGAHAAQGILRGQWGSVRLDLIEELDELAHRGSLEVAFDSLLDREVTQVVASIEEPGGDRLEGGGPRGQPPKSVAQEGERLGPGGAQTLEGAGVGKDLGEGAPPIPGVLDRDGDVGALDVDAPERRHARESGAVRLGDDGEDRQDIADLGSLEVAAEVQHGDTVPGEAGGQGVQAGVGPGQYGLPPERDPVVAQPSDLPFEKVGLAVVVLPDQELRRGSHVLPRRFSGIGKSGGREPFPITYRVRRRGEGPAKAGDVIGRTVVESEGDAVQLPLARGEILLEPLHVQRRGAAEPIDALAGIAHDPDPVLVAP